MIQEELMPCPDVPDLAGHIAVLLQAHAGTDSPVLHALQSCVCSSIHALAVS